MEPKELTELMATLTRQLGEHERKMRKLYRRYIGNFIVFTVLVFMLIVCLYLRPLEAYTCLKSMQVISLYFVIPCIVGGILGFMIYLCKIKLLGDLEEIKADNVLKRKIEWEYELSRLDTARKEQDYSIELRRRVEGLHKKLEEELKNLLEENKSENKRLNKLLDLYTNDK